MAMGSQFLGFMLDAYDMALVLTMAPILVKLFSSPEGTEAWKYIIDRSQLFDNHGGQTGWLRDLRADCR